MAAKSTHEESKLFSDSACYNDIVSQPYIGGHSVIVKSTSFLFILMHMLAKH